MQRRTNQWLLTGAVIIACMPLAVFAVDRCTRQVRIIADSVFSRSDWTACTYVGWHPALSVIAVTCGTYAIIVIFPWLLLTRLVWREEHAAWVKGMKERAALNRQRRKDEQIARERIRRRLG